MDIGDAFRTRITDRVGEAIGKYFDRGFSGHAYHPTARTLCFIGIVTGGGSIREPVEGRAILARDALQSCRRTDQMREVVFDKSGRTGFECNQIKRAAVV